MDYEMVSHWWEAHGHPVVPAHLLAPCGFIAGRDGIDYAALFIYFDKHTPICFAERVVTVPGLSVAEAAHVIQIAGEAAKDFCRKLGYEVMMMRVPKAIARFAHRGGFVVDEREIVNMSCLLQEEALCPRLVP
jgi:hypothetical protein